MSIVIHLRDPDRPTRAAQIEVLHVCQHPLCPFRDCSAATVTSVDDAPGDGQGQWDGPCVCEFTLESKREALLENLDLYPSSGLRFIEEDVLAYIADPDRVSARIRLVIQALGLYTVTGHWSRVTSQPQAQFRLVIPSSGTVCISRRLSECVGEMHTVPCVPCVHRRICMGASTCPFSARDPEHALSRTTPASAQYMRAPHRYKHVSANKDRHVQDAGANTCRTNAHASLRLWNNS